MGKTDCYMGAYLALDQVNQEESGRLASNLCTIGMPLAISYETDGGIFRVSTASGLPIGTIRPKNRVAFQSALEAGWVCRAWLSLVYYDNAAKLFSGEIVYQMFNADALTQQELERFEGYSVKTSSRLASGKRPSVSLNSAGYESVAQTGDWTTEAETPLPIDTSRGGGKVVFKRKMGVADKMTQAVLNRNPGCIVPLVVALVALIAAIAVSLLNCMGPQ